MKQGQWDSDQCWVFGNQEYANNGEVYGSTKSLKLKILEKLDLEEITCVFYQALYAKTAEILWKGKNLKAIIRMGTLHTNMQYWPLGKDSRMLVSEISQLSSVLLLKVPSAVYWRERRTTELLDYVTLLLYLDEHHLIDLQPQWQ